MCVCPPSTWFHGKFPSAFSSHFCRGFQEVEQTGSKKEEEIFEEEEAELPELWLG